MLDFSLEEEPKISYPENIKNTEKENKTVEKLQEEPKHHEQEDETSVVDEESEIIPQQSRFVRPEIGKERKQTEKVKRPVGRPASVSKNTIQAKAIPKDLLELARRDAGIPSTVSNSNAVAAYIYLKASDKSNVSLSEELKEIIDECNGDTTVQSMNERLVQLENNMQGITKKMDELMLGLNYLILNAAGLSYENANTAAEVNLLEEGILDIRNQVRKQTKELRRYDNNNGRPFR